MWEKQQAVCKGGAATSLIGPFTFTGIWARTAAAGTGAQIVSEAFSHLESTINSPVPSAPAHAGGLPPQASPAGRRLPLPGIGGNRQINPEHASGGSVTLRSSW